MIVKVDVDTSKMFSNLQRAIFLKTMQGKTRKEIAEDLATKEWEIKLIQEVICERMTTPLGVGGPLWCIGKVDIRDIFTETEAQAVGLLMNGKTIKEVADELDVVERGVEMLYCIIYEKMGGDISNYENLDQIYKKMGGCIDG